jgi:hypothetical protein
LFGFFQFSDVAPETLILRSSGGIIFIDLGTGMAGLCCFNKLVFVHNTVELFVGFLIFFVVLALDFFEEMSK